MSLSAHDRRELRAIEQELTASDPHLAAMMCTFSRLTAGEAMHGGERIQAGRQPAIVLAAFGLPSHRPARRWPRRPARRWPRRTSRHRTSRRHWVVRVGVLAIWLVISAALLAVSTLLGHPDGDQRCARLAPSCLTQLPVDPQAKHAPVSP